MPACRGHLPGLPAWRGLWWHCGWCPVPMPRPCSVPLLPSTPGRSAAATELLPLLFLALPRAPPGAAMPGLQPCSGAMLPATPLPFSAWGGTWLGFMWLQIDWHRLSTAKIDAGGGRCSSQYHTGAFCELCWLCVPGGSRGCTVGSRGAALPLPVPPVPSPSMGGSAQHVPKAAMTAGLPGTTSSVGTQLGRGSGEGIMPETCAWGYREAGTAHPLPAHLQPC